MIAGSAGSPIYRRYRVSGRVQGVGYRWFVRERARHADVSGAVSNADDGSVVVDVAGSPAQIAQIEDVLALGPDGADVAAVVVVMEGIEAERELHSLPYPFAIRR